MIEPEKYCDFLQAAGIPFAVGVPDSLLAPFCACVADRYGERHHRIVANEGAAIAMATGYYLASRQPALVYLQNSGQGNTVNPLTSLADPEVYGIPMLMLVGWRAAPGCADEPQHVKQGRITSQLFDVLEIPHAVLPDDSDDACAITQQLIEESIQNARPVALLVRPKTFAGYASVADRQRANQHEIGREEAIEALMRAVPKHAVMVSTTGHISRELFELREQYGASHQQDFYTVGGMGHASQIALGMAIAQPQRPVICIDGDGAWLMHMGSVPIIGQSPEVDHFRHVVLNNGVHGSVGGQPTVALDLDLPALAKASGYRYAERVALRSDLEGAIDTWLQAPGAALLEIRVRSDFRADLGRPSSTPKENKRALMTYLAQN